VSEIQGFVVCGGCNSTYAAHSKDKIKDMELGDLCLFCLQSIQHRECYPSLDSYLESLPVDRQEMIYKRYKYLEQPQVDDTFNDDTPAQTFSDIKWDEGTDDKSVKVAVCLSCDAKMPEGSLDYEAVNQGLGCSSCNSIASKMRLIGIAGQARSGKDTLASYMLDNLDGIWLRSSFADPIKEMLRAIGVDCSDDKKAVVSDDYGVTPRHMMQTLGTEWGRHMIDGDIWVKAFARLNAGECVIVPDVRFENEAELVREHGVLIHLVGRGGIEGNHVSENAIAFKPGDIVIDNSRDLAWLHGQVDGNAVLGDFISEAN